MIRCPTDLPIKDFTITQQVFKPNRAQYECNNIQQRGKTEAKKCLITCHRPEKKLTKEKKKKLGRVNYILLVKSMQVPKDILKTCKFTYI